MKFRVRYRPSGYDSYRASRVASLFNVGTDVQGFELEADLPVERRDWSIGVVCGPSGSGKSSIGRVLAGMHGYTAWEHLPWPADAPIVDAIAPDGDFHDVTQALASVGLGTVPSWLRPFHVLSAGEQFRANMARLVIEQPAKVVLDEYTSVLDRQVAQLGSYAFSKAWRRTEGQAVLLTPHHDILEWVQPDWVFDTGTKTFEWKEWVQPPTIDLEVRKVGWSYWNELFVEHHYLHTGPMPFGTAFVGFVNDEPVAHVGLSGFHAGHGTRLARFCRMVVMPEWQGAGLSMRFLNALAQREYEGEGFIGHRTTSLMHTAHPGFVRALHRDPHWRCINTVLTGGATSPGIDRSKSVGYGKHFRTVSSWMYYGDPAVEARKAGLS